MARHRQRARDRKGRQDQPHDQIHRENIPSELDNLGEEDLVEASIIAGANGEPADVDEVELEREAIAEAAQPAAPQRAAAPSGPRPGGNRVVNFLRASWSELKRVQWPDRRQVGQGTAVVLGFVILAGAYLGLLDALFNPLIKAIL